MTCPFSHPDPFSAILCPAVLSGILGGSHATWIYVGSHSRLEGSRRQVRVCTLAPALTVAPSLQDCPLHSGSSSRVTISFPCSPVPRVVKLNSVAGPGAQSPLIGSFNPAHTSINSPFIKIFDFEPAELNSFPLRP